MNAKCFTLKWKIWWVKYYKNSTKQKNGKSMFLNKDNLWIYRVIHQTLQVRFKDLCLEKYNFMKLKTSNGTMEIGIWLLSLLFFSRACSLKRHSQKTQWEWRHFKLRARTREGGEGGWKSKWHRFIALSTFLYKSSVHIAFRVVSKHSKNIKFYCF